MAMNVNEVWDSGRGNLREEWNVNSNEVGSMNLVNKDGGFKVIAISEVGV